MDDAQLGQLEATLLNIYLPGISKQRVECLQLLKALTQGGSWANHPAAIMWRGYEDLLVNYGIAICNEWISRGYKDTCLDKIKAYATFNLVYLPSWLGNEDFHQSHRSKLLRKNFDHYSEYFIEPTDLPYIWPKEV